MPSRISIRKRSNAEWLFIEKHEAAFVKAYGRAMLAIRQDARFVGLDKVREALAHEAALAALGWGEAWPRTGLRLPAGVGSPTVAFQAMCEELLPRAIEAAAAAEAPAMS